MALITEKIDLDNILNLMQNNRWLHDNYLGISCTLTRANNTTAYVKNAVINGNGLNTPLIFNTGFPTIDDNSLMEITGAQVLSSNPSGLLNLNFLFNYGDTFGAQSLTDQSSFNANFADTNAYNLGVIENISTLAYKSTTCSYYVKNDIKRLIPLLNLRRLSLILLTNATYTPIANESLSVLLTGRIV